MINIEERAVPSSRLRGERHHARMTLLPIIAEGRNSFSVAMLAVEALYRIESMVRGLAKEEEHLEPTSQCVAAPTTGEGKT